MEPPTRVMESGHHGNGSYQGEVGRRRGKREMCAPGGRWRGRGRDRDREGEWEGEREEAERKRK